jgi:uncharacterized protein YjbJ (UPF0337 family)
MNDQTQSSKNPIQPNTGKPTRPSDFQSGRGEVGRSDMDRSDTNQGRDFGRPDASNLGEVKGRIRQAWSKLTDEDLDTFDGNVDALKDSIRTAYGYTPEKTSQELDKFKKTYHLS